MGRTFARVLRHRLALGLFLLRLVVAIGILSRDSGSNLVETGAAFLLVGGLWTSTVGAVIALIEVWGLVSGSGGWVSGLVATITIALAHGRSTLNCVDGAVSRFPHERVTALPDRVDRTRSNVPQRRGSRPPRRLTI
jgi:hypothetical protein